MKQFMLVCTLLLVSISAVLGQRGSIKGVVVEKSTSDIISFATVALMKAGERMLLPVRYRTRKGVFLLDVIPFGTYEVVVSFIGYSSGTISDVTLSSSNREIDLGNIELELDAVGLEEVEVRAAARTSVNKIDRRTYRASDFETARGGTAIDVLGKLPSITISSENDIMVRGESDFVVYPERKTHQSGCIHPAGTDPKREYRECGHHHSPRIEVRRSGQRRGSSISPPKEI